MDEMRKPDNEPENIENRVKVEIFGESYVLKGPESIEYLQTLAQYVDKKVRQLAVRNSRLGKERASLLAALNIADELMKLQKKYDQKTNYKAKIGKFQIKKKILLSGRIAIRPDKIILRKEDNC
jgi:cell division protein ZapA